MINADGHNVIRVNTMKLHSGRKAVIFFNDDLEEYCVKFYTDKGKYLSEADYFTNDREDAYGTARHQLDNLVQ